MAIFNWQYDDLKRTLRELVDNKSTPNWEVLHHCLLHFERLDLWMKRCQEAYHYEEFERKHAQRKLDKIKDIIQRDINND